MQVLSSIIYCQPAQLSGRIALQTFLIHKAVPLTLSSTTYVTASNDFLYIGASSKIKLFKSSSPQSNEDICSVGLSLLTLSCS